LERAGDTLAAHGGVVDEEALPVERRALLGDAVRRARVTGRGRLAVPCELDEPEVAGAATGRLAAAGPVALGAVEVVTAQVGHALIALRDETGETRATGGVDGRCLDAGPVLRGAAGVDTGAKRATLRGLFEVPGQAIGAAGFPRRVFDTVPVQGVALRPEAVERARRARRHHPFLAGPRLPDEPRFARLETLGVDAAGALVAELMRDAGRQGTGELGAAAPVVRVTGQIGLAEAPDAGAACHVVGARTAKVVAAADQTVHDTDVPRRAGAAIGAGRARVFRAHAHEADPSLVTDLAARARTVRLALRAGRADAVRAGQACVTGCIVHAAAAGGAARAVDTHVVDALSDGADPVGLARTAEAALATRIPDAATL
jgi:hypothetical protein